MVRQRHPGACSGAARAVQAVTSSRLPLVPSSSRSFSMKAKGGRLSSCRRCSLRAVSTSSWRAAGSGSIQ